MKRKIYTLISSAKQGLATLALIACSAATEAQTTYTFNYTGGQQTITLQPGTYTLETWGANGGDNLGNGNTTFFQNGGKGGYSVGVYTLSSQTTVFVNVGGRGSNSTSSLNVTVPGGYNGGGYGSANSTAGKSSGSGGGGASHVATASGTLGSLSTNIAAVRIVGAGGGGAGESNYANTNAQYNANGGNGGGLSGFQVPSTGYQGRHGQGGTQVAGGGGGDNGSAIAGVPLQGIFGAGGFNPTAGVNTSAGGSGAGGGGGGWYGGGAGWVATGTGFNTGAGGGGSGYIGGVSNGTTAAFGQAAYVPNPDVSGNGRVLIRELCSVIIFVSGPTNTLNPSICSGQSVTLTTNAASNFSWSTGQTTSSIVVAPTTNTVYSLVATSSLNCSTSASRSVNVNSTLPIMSISNPSNNICLGQTATLTATGALSYTWANAGVVNGQTFAPQATAIYTVTGANGCGTSSAVTTITVSPLAVTASASSSLVCQGYAATLTAVSAVNGYTWQPVAQTTSLAIVSPTSTTIYTVIASDGICAGTQTVVVNTKTTPTIAITQTVVTLCLGETTTLTASGAGTGGSYSWTPGNGNTAAFLVSPSSSTLYVVSGTNSLNCTASAQVPVIVVQPLPLNVIANSTLVCSGATVNLSASGSTTYSWTNGPAAANNQVNPTAALSIYTVTGFNTTNTCTATRTIAIAAITPSVNVSSPVSMCDGGSATVTASGATTYTWNGVPMGGNNVYVASPAQTATYVLLANTNSITTNCASTHTVQVVVNSNPTVTVIPTRSVICKGQTNTLTATGAASVVWQGTLGITNAVVIKPTSTTIYTLTGTSVEGCTTTAQISAVVSACNGIEEFSNTTKIRVYPNPNNGQFYISSESAVTLRLINTLGQVIRLIELNSENNYEAEINGLSIGVYYISSETQQGMNIKLIVE